MPFPRKGHFLLATILLAGFSFVPIVRITAQTGSDTSPAKPPVFRVSVQNVYIPVAVSDSLGRYVTGLKKEHFRVFEDKVEQDVIYFSQQEAPISAGIVLDVSASMKDNNNINKAKNAITRFLQSENPEDEAFLITFNERADITQRFTEQLSSLRSALALKKPGGRTALYDAVHLGLEQIRHSRNEKKALVLISDGEDNSSRYSPAEVREFAKEADVQVYGIGEQGKLGYGSGELQHIVSLTGGRAFFPNSFNDLDYYIDLIHAELRNQYLVGYSPKNPARDGKWRKVTVRLDAPQGLPKLAVRAREGYYAPKR
ncbi:MAG: VWA domain-containing protein [Acidobacteriota bacterium]|jgi:Ca-activated chloride channel family protein|nr:VWA domain-containing protein [Acidobacteriota bacterium]